LQQQLRGAENLLALLATD